ncbi:MAG TPA: glycosyltransferase family 9 protein [Azonexus sp.]|nr:glycosyltransferase family 9 protein [Azonexus sp.]
MNILVIRRDNIGDLVCTTPMLAALRRAMPDAWIGVLVNQYNVAVMRGNPDVNEVFAYRKAKHRGPGESKLAIWLETAGLLWKLRRKGIDVAIVASPGGDRYARLVGARRIIAEKPGAPFHEVEAVGKLLAPLGIQPELGPLQLTPVPEVVAAIRPKLAELAGRKIWAIHLSAREKSRRWPAEKYIELIRRLASPERGFALFWSPGPADHPAHPGDDEKAAQVLAACQGMGAVPVVTERLEELIAALSLCDGFVGADGGAMHLAAGLKLKTAALFENSEAKRTRWYPWGAPHVLMQPPTFAVADITVEAVEAVVRELEGA